uniref:Sperm-associated antigen 1 n=1 Tax=Sipha flava TaxID=143950 RepID=A0A2S2Q9I5_9HEMI
MAIDQKRTLIEKYGIPLNHIDFDYVNKCEDPKILKGIIKILESGEEGVFPQLLRATEIRLREIKPDASILNRKLCFAQKSSDILPNEENYDILDDITKWIVKSNKQEKDLQLGKLNTESLMNGHSDQPVRKSIDLTSMFNSEKPEQELSMPKVSRVHNEPLKVSYSKWDKYDPDVEIMKLDNQEKIEKLQTIKKKIINSNSLSFGMNGTSNCNDRVESMKSYVNTMSMNGILEPQEVAIREKELGNECFKSNDYEGALLHYNTSISIYSTLEAKNNRAMSYLKLKKYEQALDDLREIIEKDPRNVKAHFRRGSCFKEISMYCLALRSFETTLKYDCNNSKALNYIKELKNIISNLPPQKLIRVREITRHYDQSVWDIEEPFRVSHGELSELNKENVEYLYEADPYGCLTECVCHLCPWHEWQERKKKWIRHKMLKNEGTRKRWQFLVPDIVPESISKSSIPEFKKPKRLNITDINSAKTNGHHENSTNINHNRVNGTDKSPCKNYESEELSLKTVSSVHEFLISWKSVRQKNNYELYNKFLRSIKPKDLPKVISTNLEEEIMSKFLKTLSQNFDPDSELDLIIEYLRAMTKVKRFNIIAKMLDNKVKEGKVFYL